MQYRVRGMGDFRVASLKSPRRGAYAAIFVSTIMITPACSGFSDVPEGPAAPSMTQVSSQHAAAQERTADLDANDENESVADLPFARGATFRCLDDYLAHLERQGAIDLPWWREIAPGMYEHITRATNATRETATREELMRRFGFEC